MFSNTEELALLFSLTQKTSSEEQRKTR
ncbi:hypothetical protein P4S72_21120 [Vibrio sp. PP-XX7]